MKEMFENCLFRYRKLNDKNIQALNEDKLFFSTPSNFNDPYDNRMYVDKAALEWVIRDNWKSMDDYLDQLEERNYLVAQYGRTIWHSDKKTELQNNFLNMVNDTIEQIKENYRNYMKIICFSEDYKSELMWSHYTEDQKGFLIVYGKDDIEKGLIYDKNNERVEKKSKLSRVQYDNKQVDMTACIHDFLLKYVLPNDLDVGKIPDIPKILLRDMATTKSENWKYEKEWRLIPRIIDIDKEIPFSYVQIYPKAILAGIQCSEENKKVLNDIANTKNISFYEMEMKLGVEYGLEIKSK